MAVSRAERRTLRKERVTEIFGPDEAEAALDLLDVAELAWHDCYGEVTPPPQVVEDILIVSGGRLEGLISAVRTAVIDRRDLKLAADAIRDIDARG